MQPEHVQLLNSFCAWEVAEVFRLPSARGFRVDLIFAPDFQGWWQNYLSSSPCSGLCLGPQYLSALLAFPGVCKEAAFLAV